MRKDELTILMSNYNQAQYIEKAIESVLSQKTKYKYQLWILDDLSKRDISIEIIKQYEQKYPEIIKATYRMQGEGYLRNIAYASEQIETEYYCLLDADDYWITDTKIETAIDFLRDNKDYTVFFTNLFAEYEDGHRASYFDDNIKSNTFDFYNTKKEFLIPQTTGAIFRNIVFSKGIPDSFVAEMKRVKGNPTANSYLDGDTARFLIHFDQGKAFYSNEKTGVYRIISTSKWTSIPTFDKNTMNAELYIKMNDCFSSRHKFFMRDTAYYFLCENKQIIERFILEKTNNDDFEGNLKDWVRLLKYFNIEFPESKISLAPLVKKRGHRVRHKLVDRILLSINKRISRIMLKRGLI